MILFLVFLFRLKWNIAWRIQICLFIFAQNDCHSKSVTKLLKNNRLFNFEFGEKVCARVSLVWDSSLFIHETLRHSIFFGNSHEKSTGCCWMKPQKSKLSNTQNEIINNHRDGCHILRFIFIKTSLVSQFPCAVVVLNDGLNIEIALKSSRWIFAILIIFAAISDGISLEFVDNFEIFVYYQIT